MVINLKKTKKIIIIILILILIFLLTIIIYPNKTKNNNNPNNEIKITDKMEEYDYYLKDNATTYYKTLFKELKNTLNSKDISMDEYAKLVAKMFITDLFTLDNKISSNDIGGLQFIYKDYEEDFIKIAQTTLYSSVESNIYNDRVQKLPIVNEVVIENINNSTFEYNNKNYSSYNIEVNIKYNEDLNYPKKYNLILIQEDNYLYVVSGKE